MINKLQNLALVKPNKILVLIEKLINQYSLIFTYILSLLVN